MRSTVPGSAIPRALIRTRSADGSQHCVALRAPGAGFGPPKTVTHAVAPSGEIADAMGSTPSGTVRIVAPLSASSTMSLSSAGSGTTLTRCPSAPLRVATAGPPAMKLPRAPDSLAIAALESVVYVMNWATDFARESGGPPGVRLAATSAGNLPTELIIGRCVTPSMARPCTPGRPLNVVCASTRLSRQASRHALPGETTHTSPGSAPKRTPATRPVTTLCTPAGVTRWPTAKTPWSLMTRCGGCTAAWRSARQATSTGESGEWGDPDVTATSWGSASNGCVNACEPSAARRPSATAEASGL